MSEARALTNTVGNGVATLIVAKWSNELDEKRLHAELNNEVLDDDIDETSAVAGKAH